MAFRKKSIPSMEDVMNKDAEAGESRMRIEARKNFTS